VAVHTYNPSTGKAEANLGYILRPERERERERQRERERMNIGG
jgi:hypothetical protein